MVDELFALMAARRGHYLLESGHHGELWLDVDRIFRRPTLLRPLVRELSQRLALHGAEVVCGPMTGGAFVAQMVAEELDVDFVYANHGSRRRGDELFAVDYRIPDMFDDIVRGRRVAVVNDVINAGSAVRGTLADLARFDARPAAVATLLTLGSAAVELAAAAGVPLISVAQTPNQIWTPDKCPLCMAGARLIDLDG